MEDLKMCYVAEDPDKPGVALAFVTDNPNHADDIASEITGWVKNGYHVQRVPVDVAREMLARGSY